MEFFGPTDVTPDVAACGIYFSPAYGEVASCGQGGEWEACVFKDLVYVYLKRPWRHAGTTYYDLCSPPGYSGFSFQHQETLQTFLPMFRDAATKRHYVTEVVCQAPYLDIALSMYTPLATKTLYAITPSGGYEEYLSSRSSKVRNMIRKATRLGLDWHIEPFSEDCIETFSGMYHATMDKVGASSDYYYPPEYFLRLSFAQRVSVTAQGRILGQCLILRDGARLHYHLSCTDNSDNCITICMLDGLVRRMAPSEELILGCGKQEGDSLAAFKRRLSTHAHVYTVFKNILNPDVYNDMCHGLEGDQFPLYRHTERVVGRAANSAHADK